MTPLKESNGWSKVSEAHIDLVNRTKAAKHTVVGIKI